MHKAKFLSKSRVHNSTTNDLITVLRPLCLLWCKFQIITLKTVGDVAETRTIICHVYKATFLCKSRVYNSTINDLITVLWPLCTCSVYMLTMVQSSKPLPWKLKEELRRHDQYCKVWRMYTRTDIRITEGKTICPPALHGRGIKIIKLLLSDQTQQTRVVLFQYLHYENMPIHIYRKFHLQKLIFFLDNNSDIFHISSQNIDCGYSLEPPRWGGSNEYPQYMFLSRNKNNNVYPCFTI